MTNSISNRDLVVASFHNMAFEKYYLR